MYVCVLLGLELLKTNYLEPTLGTILLLKSRWIIPSLAQAVKLVIYLDLLTPSLPNKDLYSVSFYSCFSNYPVCACRSKQGRVVTLPVLSVCLLIGASC